MKPLIQLYIFFFSFFFSFFLYTVVYLKNRSPTKYLEHKTPFEAFYGFKPKVSHLRIFGCKAFAHIPKEDRRKLDAEAIKCIFIGYCTDQKAYKMYDPSTHKVFVSRDVIFHEHVDKQIKEDEHNVWQPLLGSRSPHSRVLGLKARVLVNIM